MLKAENISFSYPDGGKQKKVLKDISYEFVPGTFYSILGKSGSGKTTLLSLLSGLDQPMEGCLSLDNQAIETRVYRRDKVGIVFQNYHLIPYMSGLQNVLTAMRITRNTGSSTEKALSILNSLGIDSEKAKRNVGKLSGGEKQRIAIARALSTDVDIIFADEPTGNLDSKTEKEIIEIFKSLAHEQNKCVIVVTHSDKVARSSDEILKIKDGKLI